jgi:hypothetical protein
LIISGPTYQERQLELVEFGDEVVNPLNRIQTNAYVRNSFDRLDQIQLELDLLEVTHPLTGIKQALSSLYDVERAAMSDGVWRLTINHLNADAYLRTYGPLDKFGKTTEEKYYLGPWLSAQITRCIIYDRWVDILKEQGVDAALIEIHTEGFNKTLIFEKSK